MIALLRGVLIEKHPNQAIVETGGVGYDVTIPVSTYTHLPEAGAEVRLRIHTHVREDALALYGFLTQDEKALFEKLIGVSGIGPNLAIKVLSGTGRRGSHRLSSGAAKWTSWCAFPASARRPPSAWCWSCATSCPRLPAKNRPERAWRAFGALSPPSNRMSLGAAESGLRASAGRSRVRKANAWPARAAERKPTSEPFFRASRLGTGTVKLRAHARPEADFRRSPGR